MTTPQQWRWWIVFRVGVHSSGIIGIVNVLRDTLKKLTMMITLPISVNVLSLSLCLHLFCYLNGNLASLAGSLLLRDRARGGTL